jgi:hypothetical protein
MYYIFIYIHFIIVIIFIIIIIIIIINIISNEPPYRIFHVNQYGFHFILKMIDTILWVVFNLETDFYEMIYLMYLIDYHDLTGI